MSHIFLDESGDPGFKFDRGSSRYFVATLVCFPDDAQYASSCSGLAAFRAKYGLPHDYELKFSNLNRQRKSDVLSEIVRGNFQYHAFALNKAALWDGALRQKNKMYHKVVCWLLSNSEAVTANAKITLDKCGNKDFYKELHKEARNTISSPPASLKPADSRTCEGLQIADLICGTIARHYTGGVGAQQHYNIIKHRQASSRVWPV